MAKVYFLLGGNLGDREQILSNAIEKMNKEIGSVVECSAMYETEPWGFDHELNFLNQVVVVDSDLKAIQILDITQGIEKDLGRIRKKNQYSERTIDIDILFYGEEIISSERLDIPHPRIQERMFALMPLMDVGADLVHPVIGKSIKKLLVACPDKMEVKKYK